MHSQRSLTLKTNSRSCLLKVNLREADDIVVSKHFKTPCEFAYRKSIIGNIIVTRIYCAYWWVCLSFNTQATDTRIRKYCK